MFNSYKRQTDALEKFRIKAHLRSYVKDPIIIDEVLLQEAIKKLKRLPYEYNDPTDSVAIELLQDAYRSGYLGYENLTDIGCRLIRLSKHRRHQQRPNERTQQNHPFRIGTKKMSITL